ncbi:hypothetical protein FXO38_04469 [Capsicum annuum]|nr:hypothetical protein FXO38_04469 [Capsicum annuum]KAF3683570.1 hypothetical protein FXO37_01762 [Capsicum annuum]
MRNKHCVVQAQLCKCAMSLEIKGNSSSAIVIRANGTSLHFTPREFAIFTRLNCVSNREDFVFNEDVPNRLVEKYFNVVIPRLHFDLVDSERYKNFSWGTLSFEDLARSLNNWLKDGEKFYLIQGLPLAIQSPTEEEAVSKPESPVEKEAVTSKKIFDAFHNEEQFADKQAKQSNVDDGGLEKYGQHFSPNVVKSSNNTVDGIKQQYADKDPKLQHMCYAGTETSLKRFSPNVDQKLGENLNGTKINNGHYATVLSEIEKLAKIISLCLQPCDFYVKKGIDLQNHSRYKDKDSSDMFDVLFEDNLPQQPSEILDCGLIFLHMQSAFTLVTKFLRLSSTPMHSVENMLHYCGTMVSENKKQMLIVISKHP